MIDVEAPAAGYYRTRLVKGGAPVGVRIWFGVPLDPVTGEEMDRGPRWQADVNGKTIADLNRVWPGCTGEPIDEAEYRYLTERASWAEENDRHDPFGSVGHPVDWLTSTPAF